MSWLGRLLLRHPQLSKLGSVPVVGPPLKAIARRTVPKGERMWVRVEAGPNTGAWMYLDPRFDHLYVGGSYERAVQDLLVTLLRPGDTFYDVGAHNGFLSLLGARLVGPTGEVHAFEADPGNASRLRDTFAKNAFPQATVWAAAAWSQGGTVTFVRDPAESSRNRGAVGIGAADGEATTVDAMTLDDAASRGRAPAVVKIDVEGGEGHVLAGAMLALRSLPCVIVEVHSPALVEEVTDRLTQLGYDLKPFASATEGFAVQYVAQHPAGRTLPASHPLAIRSAEEASAR